MTGEKGLRNGDPLWGFSLEIYGRPGVASALLGLQDRHGLNVNLLLYSLWAGRQGAQLGASDFHALIAAIAPWEAAVIKPLRSARNWLKTQDSAPEVGAAALRKGILAKELEAEALEQQVIQETRPLEAGEPARTLAEAALSAYLEAAGIESTAADRAALDLCLDTVFPINGRS